VPTPEQAKALADLGGFALFLFTVIAGVVGVWRGWIVPGWLYQQEREARMRAELQATRTAEALMRLARSADRERKPPGGR
jgi:hypothetical protein